MKVVLGLLDSVYTAVQSTQLALAGCMLDIQRGEGSACLIEVRVESAGFCLYCGTIGRSLRWQVAGR